MITATAFVTALDLEVLLDDERRERIIARFAAPATREDLSETYAAEKRRVIGSYRASPRFARAALAGYRVDEFSPTQASVSIWAATIGGSGTFPPSAGWSTTTVRLTRVAKAWKVTDGCYRARSIARIRRSRR